MSLYHGTQLFLVEKVSKIPKEQLRSPISKIVRQGNAPKKQNGKWTSNDLLDTTQKTEDRTTRILLEAGVNQGAPEGKQFLSYFRIFQVNILFIYHLGASYNFSQTFASIWNRCITMENGHFTSKFQRKKMSILTFYDVCKIRVRRRCRMSSYKHLQSLMCCNEQLARLECRRSRVQQLVGSNQRVVNWYLSLSA